MLSWVYHMSYGSVVESSLFLDCFSEEEIQCAQAQLTQMSLEQQVAQRLIVGLNSPPDETPSTADWQMLARLGVGGFIFFGRDFKPFEDKTSADVAEWLKAIRNEFEASSPFPFLSIDQEGGLVEHLPPHLFPSLVSPMAVGQRLKRNDAQGVKKPTEYAAEVYDLMAVYLNMLGFNTNFAPVLDVHGCAENPVIGVRAFSNQSAQVIECADIVKERFEARGLMAVGKHAPGHGFSQLDSHLQKPTLPINEGEQETFKWASKNNMPALMVAHATYPDWQGTETLPASLSSQVIGRHFRDEWGYKGLLISDDMVMSGVAEGRSFNEAAIMAFQAGLDVLIYRYGGELVLNVHDSLCRAIESGQISREAHELAVLRILLQKNSMKAAKPLPDVEKVRKIMTPEAIESVSQYVVEGGIHLDRMPNSGAEEGEDLDILLDPEDCIALIAPAWDTIPIYKEAASHGQDFEKKLEEHGIFPVISLQYPLYGEQIDELPLLHSIQDDVLDTIVWVQYYPHDGAYHEAISQAVGQYLKSHPDCRLILVEANSPIPHQKIDPLMEFCVAHVQMWGYRHEHQSQLLSLLTQS